MKNDFLNAVCRISFTGICQGRRGIGYGNGVFITPSHVLTAWHNLRGQKTSAFTFKNSKDEQARIKTSRHNRFNAETDLALVELDQPIGEDLYRRPINQHLLGAKGTQPNMLAGYFIEQAQTSQVKQTSYFGFSKKSYIALRSEKPLSQGYSGSPIYDQNGDIVSILSYGLGTAEEIRQMKSGYEGHEMQSIQKSNRILGTSPESLASFVDSFLFDP